MDRSVAFLVLFRPAPRRTLCSFPFPHRSIRFAFRSFRPVSRELAIFLVFLIFLICHWRCVPSRQSAHARPDAGCIPRSRRGSNSWNRQESRGDAERLERVQRTSERELPVSESLGRLPCVPARIYVITPLFVVHRTIPLD